MRPIESSASNLLQSTPALAPRPGRHRDWIADGHAVEALLEQTAGLRRRYTFSDQG